MSSTVIFKAKKPLFSLPSRKSFIPFLLILIFGYLLIRVHQGLFVVKKVECRSTQDSCPESVLSLLSSINGKSFFLLSKQHLIRDIVATGLVERVEVETKVPGLIKITLQPPGTVFFVKSVFSQIPPTISYFESTMAGQFHQPSLDFDQYVASVSGKTFLLLSSGVLNQADGETNFHLISQTIPTRAYLIKVFDWLKSFGQSAIKSEAVYVFGDMIIVRQKEMPDLLMTLISNPSEISLSLQRLHEVVTIKKPAVIDFRYNHPILK